MTGQLNYAYTDRAGIERSASFWCDSWLRGHVILVSAGTFVTIRKTRVEDRRRGVKTEWVQA